MHGRASSSEARAARLGAVQRVAERGDAREHLLDRLIEGMDHVVAALPQDDALQKHIKVASVKGILPDLVSAQAPASSHHGRRNLMQHQHEFMKPLPDNGTSLLEVCSIQRQ